MPRRRPARSGLQRTAVDLAGRANRARQTRLGSATIQRLELRNCRIGTLDVTNGRLKDVDLGSSDFGALHGIEGLRGKTIDDSQLALMAPILAAHLGIVVE